MDEFLINFELSIDFVCFNDENRTTKDKCSILRAAARMPDRKVKKYCNKMIGEMFR